MTREELIAKVEGLTAPAREMDVEIARFVSGVSSKFDLVIATPYTSSVDAVLALIQERLPGWSVNISYGGDGDWTAVIWEKARPYDPDHAASPTPALALLAATLRALPDIGKEDDPT